MDKPELIFPGPWGTCRFADCLPLIDCRAKSRLPKKPRSVIVALFPWYAGEFSPRNVALYAVGDDYHRIVGEILDKACRELRKQFPLEEFAVFVDSSPIREVRAAALSGLGSVGRNGLLMHEIWGSRVFIGEIVTSLALEPLSLVMPDNAYCGDCRRCIGDCPTGALSEYWPLDKALCRSAITQKKQTLTAWEENELRAGGLAWGCELCQVCCPRNNDPPLTPVAAFLENLDPVVTQENLARIIPRKTYSFRGEGVLRRNLFILDNHEQEPPNGNTYTGQI